MPLAERGLWNGEAPSLREDAPPVTRSEIRFPKWKRGEFLGPFLLVLTIGLAVLDGTPMAPWQSARH